MEKFYRFAGIELSVEIPDDQMFTDARDLTPFEVNSVSDPHRFRFELVEQLQAPKGSCVAAPPGVRIYEEGTWTVRYSGSVQDSWEPAYMRSAHRGKDHIVQVKASQYSGRIGAHVVLGSLAAEHMIAGAGGFVFHSSYIEWNERGILFTAPSGTGKSTQAELWRRLRGARIINGDRSAVRFENGAAVADGIPFSGSSQDCINRTLPLAAVVYLSQAPETTIRKLRGYEAFFRIWEGCSVNTWDAEDMRLVSETVKKVSETVPVYHLACTPDETAVQALEHVLRE